MAQRGRPRKNTAPAPSAPASATPAAGGEAGADRVRSADYRYDASTPLRPEVGAAPQYLNQAKAKREPATYRYDSSLAPVLEWDGNPVVHRRGDEVPAWFLDTDYNGLCFKVSQAFFPKTGAWDNLKKSLRITHDEAVWDHLAGTVSAPFRVYSTGQQIAVKVIDERGNELVVTKPASMSSGKKRK